MASWADPTSPIILLRKELWLADRKPSINTSSNATYQNTHSIWKKPQNSFRSAGGKLVIAHPDDPHGTSLAAINQSLVRADTDNQRNHATIHRRRRMLALKTHTSNNKSLCCVCKREWLNHDRRQRLPPKTSRDGHR